MSSEATFLDELGGAVDADSLDARMAAGGNIPPGKYHAKLNGAKETVSKQKGTPGYELTFIVVGGPFDGTEVTDTLYRTDNQKTRDRLALFGSRLGLLVRGNDGKLTMAKGKRDFMDCLDTPCVIEITHEKYTREDKSEGHAVRLAFNGIHDPADPKVKAEMAAGGKPATGATPAKLDKSSQADMAADRNQPPTTTTAKKKPNISDL